MQSMEVEYMDESLYLRSICIPEMKKDLVYSCTYKVAMRLDHEEYDISGASCGYPADKGPKASCKHVGALCYALVEFSTSCRMSHFLASTDKPQAWHTSKPRKMEQTPVTSFS